MPWTIGALAGVKETMSVEMFDDLPSNDLLEDFANEGKVRDEPIVLQFIFVK